MKHSWETSVTTGLGNYIFKQTEEDMDFKMEIEKCELKCNHFYP